MPVPVSNLILLGVALLVVSGLSFLAGIVFEKWYLASAVKRASRELSKMVDLVAGRTKAATLAWQQLSQFERSRFSQTQVQMLTRTQQELAQAFEAILARELGERSLASGLLTPVEKVSWQLLPLDPRSDLPDETCCRANLTQLLSRVSRGLPASLLLVQIDKFSQLIARHGPQESGLLLKNVARMLIAASRDTDVICQLSDDLLVVLMPDSSAQASREAADTLRQAIRAQRFRLPTSQQEILVTSSFGLALLKPGDDESMALGRARDALSESRRYGRNQLHLHDGERAQLCRA